MAIPPIVVTTFHPKYTNLNLMVALSRRSRDVRFISDDYEYLLVAILPIIVDQIDGRPRPTLQPRSRREL